MSASTALSITNPASRSDLSDLSTASSVQSFSSLTLARSRIIPYAKFDRERESIFDENPQNVVTQITPKLKQRGFKVVVLKKYYVNLADPVEIEFLLNESTNEFMLFTTSLYTSGLTADQCTTIENDIAIKFAAKHVTADRIGKVVNGKFQNKELHQKYDPQNPNQAYALA